MSYETSFLIKGTLTSTYRSALGRCETGTSTIKPRLVESNEWIRGLGLLLPPFLGEGSVVAMIYRRAWV